MNWLLHRLLGKVIPDGFFDVCHEEEPEEAPRPPAGGHVGYQQPDGTVLWYRNGWVEPGKAFIIKA